MSGCIQKLACQICNKVDIPGIDLLHVSGYTVFYEMQDLNLRLMYEDQLLDSTYQDYYFTTLEGWREVFDYIYHRFPMPPYIEARRDCEDFAIHLKGLVSALFGLNYFALVIGPVNVTHAFNLLRTEDTCLLWEPQLKFGYTEPFAIGEHNYRPRSALL